MAFWKPKFLSTPWRAVNWKDYQEDLQYVKNYKPQVEGQHLRILLYGPAGAGKSSFINSVQSVLMGRIYRQALTNNAACGCFTKEYATFHFLNEHGSFYPFVFNDIMGLSENTGVLEEDIQLALEGHVKEGYRFSSETPLTKDKPDYVSEPELNDKVHVLVCVVPADTLSIMKDEVLWKIRNIRKEAAKLMIPQVAVLTKVQEMSPEIKKDLRNVYKTPYMKEKMEKFSSAVGIPLNCIFPVENYYEELILKDTMNSLILSAMRHIINCGEDFLNFSRNRISSSSKRLMESKRKPRPPPPPPKPYFAPSGRFQDVPRS